MTAKFKVQLNWDGIEADDAGHAITIAASGEATPSTVWATEQKPDHIQIDHPQNGTYL